MTSSPRIVCLIGSTKFKKEFERANMDQSALGKIVLTVCWFSHTDGYVGEAAEQMFRDLHFHKIDMAHEVFVVNPGDYIGDHARAEILYAIAAHKPIYFLEETKQASTFKAAAVQNLFDAPKPGSKWVHYKGGTYTVVASSVKEDTLEVLVTYTSDTYGFAMTRTLGNWNEEIDRGGGCSMPRFRPAPA